MKKSTKAVLLSAFVFPGVGHIFLRKYRSGIVLAGASFAGFYYMVSIAVAKALKITENIQSGDVPLDIAAITELVTKQSTGTEAQLLNIATATLIICWLIGIIDSYRAGRTQDKADDISVNKHDSALNSCTQAR